MRYLFITIIVGCSLQMLAQQHCIAFDSATTSNNVMLDFKQITRQQANGYKIKIWFKNISQQTLYFNAEADAWNDVSDFGHYLRKRDSVIANQRKCIVVAMYLGAYKRRLNHYGNIQFRNKNDSVIATYNANIKADIMDSMMPVQVNQYILFDKNRDTDNQILNLGTLETNAHIQGKHLVKFKNIAKYSMSIYTLKKWHVVNDTIFNKDTIRQNKHFSWRDMFAHDTIAPNAYGYMYFDLERNDEILNEYKLSKPSTFEYTLFDDGGTIETKKLSVQLAAIFKMPQFEAVFIPSRLNINWGNATPNLKLVTDNNPDIAFIKIQNLTGKKMSIQLIPKKYKRNWYPFVTSYAERLPYLETMQEFVNSFE